MKKYLLGVDVGSSSEKVAVFDTEGNILALAKADYPTYSDKEGWYEQDAEDYYRAFLKCLDGIDRELLSSVAAIGFGGQTPTDVFVDKDGVPVRRAIMWRDTRAAAQLERQKERFSFEELEEMSGCPIPKSQNWTTLRMAWVKDEEPENAARIYKVLQAKDYLIYKITGRLVTDLWSARPFQNINTGAPLDELIAFFGYDRGIIPQCFRASELCGEVTDKECAVRGLPLGTGVACGCSDGFTSILSSGLFAESGVGFNCTGTSEMAGVTVKGEKRSDGMFIFPENLTGEKAVCFGPTQSGGTSLLWFCEKVLGIGYTELIEKAEKSVPGANGLVFLPYIAGERAPIWDGEAKGSFFGIKESHTDADFARSVLEGVALSIRSLLEATGEEAPKRVRLLGGGSRVELWCRIRADILGADIEIVDCNEACAQGGAAIAGIGIGEFKSYSDAARKMCKVKKTYTPNPDNKEVYDKSYRIYKALYEATKELMHT